METSKLKKLSSGNSVEIECGYIETIQELILLKKKMNSLVKKNELLELKIKETCKRPNECVICLESLQNMDFLSLSCNHTYHLDCMMNLMIKSKPSCPLCRKDIKLPRILQECQSKNNEIKDLNERVQILVQENARFEYILNSRYDGVVVLQEVDDDTAE